MKPPAQRNTVPWPGAVAQQRPRFADAPKRFTAEPKFVAPRYEHTKNAFFRNIQRMTWEATMPLKDLNEMHYRIGGAPPPLDVNKASCRPFTGRGRSDPLYDRHTREFGGNFTNKSLMVASTGAFILK